MSNMNILSVDIPQPLYAICSQISISTFATRTSFHRFVNLYILMYKWVVGMTVSLWIAHRFFLPSSPLKEETLQTFVRDTWKGG